MTESPPPDGPPASLTADELADLADTTPERVRELTEAGLLEPAPGPVYVPGDVHRIRFADAFRAAGIGLDAIAAGTRQGTISFRYYHELHPDPASTSPRTYGEFKASLGEQAAFLEDFLAAVGFAEPDPASRLPIEDERIVARTIEIYAAVGQPDLVLRVARLYGEGLRRASEAALTIYAEAVERAEEGPEVLGDALGVPSDDVYDRYFRPWSRLARQAPELTGWLTRRHLAHAIDAWSVEATEDVLARNGLLPERPARPPTIAFVDLAGFTRLTEERGDRASALVAAELRRLAEAAAEGARGRVVKLLGDGVLLRFDDAAGAAGAAGASLDLLAELARAGLPDGHAGIEAGPVIVRDGDVFGRTVNLASRLSDAAEAGEVLAGPEAAAAIRATGRFVVEAAGSAELRGFDLPVDIARIRRRPS